MEEAQALIIEKLVSEELSIVICSLTQTKPK